jgi:hypothetical protein
MSTISQPPRPPIPPEPPKPRSNVLAIALLVLALIVVTGGIAVWTGLHFLSSAVRVKVAEEGGEGKGVSIKTPLGSLEVNKDISPAGLGLPIYPGATRLKDQDSATVNIDIANAPKVHVLAGKFETSDPLDKVEAFYHDRLGDQVTKFTDKNEEGKVVFEIKHDKQQKVVALKSSGDKTVIELVHVSEGQEESN